MFSTHPVIPKRADAFSLTLDPKGSDRDLARSLTSVLGPPSVMRKRSPRGRKIARSTVPSDDEPIPFVAPRPPLVPSGSHDTDEIAARLTRDTEARLQESRRLVDATKRTLKRTRPERRALLMLWKGGYAGTYERQGMMAYEHASGDFDRAAMLTLMSEDDEANDLAFRVIASRGTKTVSGAARDAFVLAHQATRETGEFVSPVICFKERLRVLLDEPMMH
jgi:hypothetical protein